MSEISTKVLEPTTRRALGRDDDSLGDIDPRLRSGRPHAVDRTPALYRPAHARPMGHAPEAR